MILRVTFKNILSFKEETAISFVAGKSTTHAEQVLRADPRKLKDVEFAGSKEAVKVGESLVLEPKKYSTIDEAVLMEPDHLPFVFDNNKELFHTSEGVKAMFDKNMPALQQK